MRKKVFGILLSLAIGVASLFPAQAWATKCSDVAKPEEVAKMTFFGMKSWYYYLDCETVDGKLTVAESNFQGDNLANGIWTIALTILSDLFFIAGILAVVMIVVSGIKLILSAGDPASATRAKNSLSAAVIGLVIVLVARLIVNTILNIVIA